MAAEGFPPLLDDDDVRIWVATNNPGGLEKLVFAIRNGEITGREAQVCRVFLEKHTALSDAAKLAMRETLYVRSIAASDRAARRATLAVIVALAAFAVSLVSFWLR
jgi:hypothetical protein